MYMKLSFTNLDAPIKAKKYVIGPTHWIWTYKGEDGGHEYLHLPRDFGYLSFGLLWSKSNRSEYPINIYHSGNCSGLTVGQNKSDHFIGKALGDMTSYVASRDNFYNSSYWCYNQRRIVSPLSLYRACENSICTLQTIEYKCCKYKISFLTRERHIECSSEKHYQYNELWWALPIVLGEVCFALYPLLLSSIAGKIQKLSKKANIRTKDESDSEESPQIEYIRLRQGHPVTLMSTVLSPCSKMCTFQGLYRIRVLRALVIILPMVLPAIRLSLDASFSYNIIKDAVEQGAIVGFSSIIAGNTASGGFLFILGGPIIAVILHVIFGTLLVTFPDDLEALLVNGLFNPKRNPYFILTIPLKYREKLGRITLNCCSGYHRFHNYLLLQLHMTLNWKFWRHVLRIFRHRWTMGIVPFVRRWTYAASYVFMLSIFPFYLVFCIIEAVFCLVYFAAPVVSCFFILLNAYIKALCTYFGNRSWPIYIFSRLFIAGIVIAFCITWYMNCVIFFDGFWLLTRIIMFTYTGIIQFPRLSYGYIILVFMTFYYIMESLNNFGANYRDLLKLTIEVCEKVQCKSSSEFADYLISKNSIPVQLFNTIVERHMPKRVQVFMTVIKVGLVVSILWISIDLLIRFDKFQDLSLVSHVFTVLFVCALPKICRTLCMKQHRHKTRTKLRQRIYRTVTEYCNKDGNMDSSSDIEDFSCYSAAGYEALDIESD